MGDEGAKGEENEMGREGGELNRMSRGKGR